MNDERELLSEIKRLVSASRYRIRIHTVRHMIGEGFGEADLLEAVAGKSRILENYSDEGRCLILGYFLVSEKIRSPLRLLEHRDG